MADRVKRDIQSVSYKILNNLSSLDFEPAKKKTKTHGKNLGFYEEERIIGRKQDGEVRMFCVTAKFIFVSHLNIY